MWFGTGDNGVSRYDGKKFVNFTQKEGLIHDTVISIHCDPDGIMWFGTGYGVSRFDSSTFVNFTPKDGLAGDAVIDIYQDLDGTIWFGTDDYSGGGGVSHYNENQFINLTVKDGLRNSVIMDIYRDSDGIMWFGTQGGGVFGYNGKEFINYTTKDGLADNVVNAIHCDQDGVMWFGTGVIWFGAGGSISRFDGKKFVNFPEKYGWGNFRDIYQGSDGLIWFGTNGGVLRYDGKEFVDFTTEDGLLSDNVYAIHGTPGGIMWFGTYDGVSRYDGRKFANFTAKDGLAGNIIQDVYCDSDGKVWFGTVGGVSQYDGKKFISFTQKDGLANNDVWSIYSDSDGIMWSGTLGGGVSGYDGIAWTSLDTRDGLASDVVNSIYQDSDGFLWFGTREGVTRYRRSTNPPSVRVVSVKMDKDYMEATQENRFLRDIPSITTGTRVTIAYNALDFKTVPEKRQYRCRITEVQSGTTARAEGWRKPTKSSVFDYTFNESGNYTFEVQAIDRDLNYSEPASIILKIVPPFYMTFGFLIPTIGFVTIITVTLTIVSIGYIKRRRQVQAYQQSAVEELQEARKVQMALMPEKAPEIDGLEIAGKCIPANTVSGDFFDYLQSNQQNEIGLVVADITGKGMKGAMNAVMTDGILHMAAKEQEQLSPAFLMMELNDVLKVRMERDMNVTMVIAVISRKNDCSMVEPPNNIVSEEEVTLILANAAHHAYPLLLRKGEIQTLKTGGLPLGVRAGIEYSEEQFQLQRDDVLVFMTDGIIEAQDSEDNYYSESGRLEKIISQFTFDLSAETMVESIINDAMSFGGDKSIRDDDITVVVVKIL